MEQIQTTFDDSSKVDDYLEHHGIKGMKWGVWNSETQRKYSGGLGRASNAMKAKLSSAGGSVAKGVKGAARFATAKVSAKAKSAAAERTKKKENKKEAQQIRKELGMSPKKYNDLRKRTLKSHDPSVIEKGMHTLTDAELDDKIRRLQKEETISKMATSQQTRRAMERKAKSEAIQANPVYKIGKGYLDQYVNKKINSLVSDGGGKNKNEKKSQSDGGSDKKNKSGPAHVPLERHDIPTSTSDNTVRYGSEKPATSSYVNWNASKALTGNVSAKTADRGKSWIDDDVIDVTPSDYSSSKKKRK